MDCNINNFEEFLIKNKKSSKTIESYKRDVKQFLNYFSNKKLNEIKDDDIDEYKNFLLYDCKLKVKSVNRKLVAIKQYLMFCHIVTNVKQEKIHIQNFLDEILTDEDIEKILNSAKNNNDIRAVALISTMKMTGMRISEVLQLTTQDIDKDTVNIIGKGNKRRDVFVPQKLKEIWKEYMMVRANKGNKLFTGKRGGITRFTAHKIIKKYAQISQVDLQKAHVHNLRHYYAKSLAEKGIPIEAIADLIGHSDINTTRIYTRKTKKELLNIINSI